MFTQESMAFGRPEPTVRELVTMVVVPKAGFEHVIIDFFTMKTFPLLNKILCFFLRFQRVS